MIPSPVQIGALVVNAILFFVLYLTHEAIFERKRYRGWCILALIGGAAVGVGLIFLPTGFAAGVAQTLGGVSIAALVVWRIQINDLRTEIDNIKQENVRRSRNFLAWIYETAIRLHDQGIQDPHDYVDGLLEDGAIYTDEAATLHNQLFMLRGIARP